MRKLIWAVAISFILILASQSSAGTISPELQSVLDSAVPAQKVDVIVILKDRVNFSTFTDPDIKSRRKTILTALKDKANRTQTPVLDFLLARNAGNVSSLWLINGIAATVRAGSVPLLANHPAVAEVRLNFAIPLADPAPAGASPVEWNIDAVHASELWALGHTGQGIVIAGMDTGVDHRHEDLAGRWRNGDNSWYDPNGEHPTEPFDDHGHGTQTMGVLVGGDATGSAVGVAPGARWIAVKIFNDAGYAPLSSIHMGFQWLLDPNGDDDPADAPDVVNNSWGFRNMVDTCYLEFQADIQVLKTAGIAVVFAAGNEGPGTATSISPANNPESFAAGSVDINHSLAADSSQGPSACVIENDVFPEVVAPGVSVKTTNLTFGWILNSTAYVSGTSFAAPHVAGAMALLKGAFPDATPEELEASLKNTARDLGPEGPDDLYGYGLIDVLAAYRSMVPCTDGDGDGFYVDPACGLELDCNDSNGSVYPGAVEIKHDGIDQDCNGYDLTIDILAAQYLTGSDTLCVVASSEWDDLAGLSLTGPGAMNWNADVRNWSLVVESAGSDPVQVEVTGFEGAEYSPTTALAGEICRGDFDKNGGVDPSDLAVFAAAFGAVAGHVNYNAAADFDGTGGVDGGDLRDFSVSYGRLDCPMCY